MNWYADGKPTNELWSYYRKLARDYIVFLAYTGLRPGREVSEIRWRDVEQLTEYSREDGETVAEGVVRITRSKTGDRDPIVVNPQAAMALVRRKQESQFLDGADYVFCHPDPSNCAEPGSYYDGPDSVWKQAMRETGLYLDPITGKPRPRYSLRHTYITASQKAGVPMPAIIKQVGHTDATMIMRFYGHTDATDFKDDLRIDPYRAKPEQPAGRPIASTRHITKDSPKE
ncbi:MAG TPA: tyrosine-type recombinase/integrase [Alphaproteobacteria bacterium]|nr:tyrosine-type recombinase/integrase [Alphaproteobacteria bacterium]